MQEAAELKSKVDSLEYELESMREDNEKLAIEMEELEQERTKTGFIFARFQATQSDQRLAFFMFSHLSSTLDKHATHLVSVS